MVGNGSVVGLVFGRACFFERKLFAGGFVVARVVDDWWQIRDNSLVGEFHVDCSTWKMKTKKGKSKKQLGSNKATKKATRARALPDFPMCFLEKA